MQAKVFSLKLVGIEKLFETMISLFTALNVLECGEKLLVCGLHNGKIGRFFDRDKIQPC